LQRELLKHAREIRSCFERLSLGQATVRRWIQSYEQHGIQGLHKKFSHYSAAFKLSMLKTMWRDDLSRRQVAVLFDVRGGHSAVAIWERQTMRAVLRH
jgi:transposase